MNKHYTVMVMDASGSMGRMREEALDACNQQLRDIRKNVEGDDIVARVGLVKFASTVEEPTVWNRPISKVNNLQKRDYKTGGMTATVMVTKRKTNKNIYLKHSSVDWKPFDQIVGIVTEVISEEHSDFDVIKIREQAGGVRYCRRFIVENAQETQWRNALSA